MSTRQNPPRMSPLGRGPRVVTDHAGKSSVGHNVGTRSRKTILDKENGRGVGKGQAPGGQSAPDSNGPPLSSW